MRILKALLLWGALGAMLITAAAPVSGAERDRGRFECRSGDRITIEDLDVSPDPLIEGQRIRSWRVRLRLDGNRECETAIMIREGNDLVAQGQHMTLRPGINEIDIPAGAGYRFRGREHCFDVLVDLQGTRRRIDTDRRFCAQQRPSWSLREPGDRGRLDR
ncbi:MAG: hypothetical protein ACM3TN_17170 [Alphaproteobacteria bacterium]